jgi:hypothetical protein
MPALLKQSYQSYLTLLILIWVVHSPSSKLSPWPLMRNAKGWLLATVI